jgi:hypothetical protein
MLEYLPAVTALAALLAGIAGDTTDRKKTGLRRVRPIGWLTLVIGLASFVFSLLLTHSSQEQAQESQIRSIRNANVGYLRIQSSLDQLVRPLEIVLDDSHEPLASMFTGHDQFDMGLQRFQEASFRKKLASLRFDQPTPGGTSDSDTWAYTFARFTSSASSDLDRVIAVYGRYLPDEVLFAAEDLRHTQYMWLIQHLDHFRFSADAYGSPATLADALDDATLDEFLKRVQSLTAALHDAHDPAVIDPLAAAEMTGKQSEVDIALRDAKK